MAISESGAHGTPSVITPDKPTLALTYIRVLPTTMSSFTIVTDIGTTLTQSNFTDTGSYLEYYAGVAVEDITSASASGYTYSKTITETSSHGDTYRYIDITFSALTSTDTVFRVWPVDIKTFEVRTNGGNFNKSLFVQINGHWEYVRDDQGYSISYITAYGYTGTYTTSGSTGSTIYFDITFTPDPTVIPPYFNLYAWSGMSGIGPATYVYTKRRNPNIGDNVYNADCTLLPYSNTISHVYTSSTTSDVTSFEANGTYLRADAINDLIVQPDELYGWTDFSLGTQFYGWTEPGESLYAWAYRGSDVYTHSSMPLAGDYIYNADGTVVSNNPQVEEDSDGSTMYDGYTSWSRDSANDIIGTDTSYYTTSTTPTVGMTLYDENGTDTGLIVGTISGDSFDIQTSYSINFVKGSYVTNYTIDGTTYTSNTTLNLTEGNHTIGITGTYNSLAAQASGNNIISSSVTIVNGVTSTGAYSGTLNITSSGLVSIPYTSNYSYDFGTAPMTITFEGSMNSGGGNN